MEAIVYVLIACVVTSELALLCFLGYREHEHRKQMDEITSKLIAKTLTEYSNARHYEKSESQPRVEKPKKYLDETLGSI